MSDLLTLPDPVGNLLNWMTRQELVGLEEVAVCLEQDEEHARATLAGLIERGFVREIEMRGVMCYRVHLAPKRGREIPRHLWQALEDKVEE